MGCLSVMVPIGADKLENEMTVEVEKKLKILKQDLKELLPDEFRKKVLQRIDELVRESFNDGYNLCRQLSEPRQ